MKGRWPYPWEPQPADRPMPWFESYDDRPPQLSVVYSPREDGVARPPANVHGPAIRPAAPSGAPNPGALLAADGKAIVFTEPEVGTTWLMYVMRTWEEQVSRIERGSCQFWHSTSYPWWNEAFETRTYDLPEARSPAWERAFGIGTEVWRHIHNDDYGFFLGPDDWQTVMVSLDYLFEESRGLLPYGLETVRGHNALSFGTYLELYQRHGKGMIISQRSYAATTLSLELAQRFAGPPDSGCGLVKLRLHPGDPFIHVPSVQFAIGEHELLINREQQYRITGYDQGGWQLSREHGTKIYRWPSLSMELV